MSRESSRPQAIASGSNRNFELHLFFADTNRKPRYFTDSTGKIVPAWKGLNAFEISQGDEGALVFVYSSEERPAVAAQNWLVERGYTEFLASGLINTQLSEWTFSKPADANACQEVLRGAARDAEFLRYFGRYQAVGPAGERFGLTNTFFVQANDLA
jgi:hypothetical protein